MAMIDILSKQNNLVINKIYISQYHDNSMVRKTDYIAIHITIWDNLKTILINDEYGESSFVVDWHLTKKELATLDKYDYKWYELRYDQNESDLLGKFRDKIIEKTGDNLNSQINKSLNKKVKLSEEEYKIYYKDIFDSNFWWIEKLAIYTANQIHDIKIGKKSIENISTNCWYDNIWNDNNPKTPKWFQKFLCYIYDISPEYLKSIQNKINNLNQIDIAKVD